MTALDLVASLSKPAYPRGCPHMKKGRYIFLAVGILMGISLAVSSFLGVTETKVGEFSSVIKGTKVLAVSPNNRHIAYVREGSHDKRVFVDGRQLNSYDDIILETFVFGPKSDRIAYVANKGNKKVVVVDGKAERLYDGASQIIFSPNGQRVAYHARGNGKQIVVVDGKEGKKYVGASFPDFSPDSTRVAYRVLKEKTGKWAIVVDGKEGKSYDSIDSFDLKGFRFSPNGKRLGYVAKVGKKFIAVVDEEEGKPYDEIIGPRILFSPDGSRFAYVARTGQRKFVVVDGSEDQPYDQIAWYSLVFSPNGRRLAYIATRGRKVFALIDGKEGSPYDGYYSGSLVFSPNSERISYAVAKDKQAVIVVDDREGPLYDSYFPNSLVFSSNSKRVAYIAQEKPRVVVVVDGEDRMQQYLQVVGGPIFSPDGKRWAALAIKATTDKTVLVLDGIEGKEYDSVFPKSLTFSPKGHQLGFIALDLSEPTFLNTRLGTRFPINEFVVIDGLEGRRYAPTFGLPDHARKITFLSDNAFYYFGTRKGGTSYLVEERNSFRWLPNVYSYSRNILWNLFEEKFNYS